MPQCEIKWSQSASVVSAKVSLVVPELETEASLKNLVEQASPCLSAASTMFHQLVYLGESVCVHLHLDVQANLSEDDVKRALTSVNNGWAGIVIETAGASVENPLDGLSQRDNVCVVQVH